MKEQYQMTTVYKYAQLLENDLSAKEKSIKAAVEQYLLRAKKANENAFILESLLE